MGFLSGVQDVAGRMAASTIIYPLATFSLRTGNWERARHRLSWVIQHHPRHFGSHVQLGKLYLRLGNRVQALRLLNQARWIDPLRFERTELPREIYATLGCDPTMNTHDLVIGPGKRAVSRQKASSLGLDGGGGLMAADAETEAEFSFRDFTDRDEYMRFRNLPPITEQEVSMVDWDNLLTRLHDD